MCECLFGIAYVFFFCYLTLPYLRSIQDIYTTPTNSCSTLRPRLKHLQYTLDRRIFIFTYEKRIFNTHSTNAFSLHPPGINKGIIIFETRIFTASYTNAFSFFTVDKQSSSTHLRYTYLHFTPVNASSLYPPKAHFHYTFTCVSLPYIQYTLYTQYTRKYIKTLAYRMICTN